MKAELTAANQGATNRLGLNFQGQLDTSRIGYFGYSHREHRELRGCVSRPRRRERKLGCAASRRHLGI